MPRLMIVAHPDDEVIFGFQALITDPDIHVICCTNGANQARAAEFNLVMRALGASGEIWDYPDVWGGGFPDDLLGRIRSAIVKHDAGTLITHGVDGEYGHTQHQALHRIVLQAASAGMPVVCFGTGIAAGDFLPFRVIRRKLDILSLYLSQVQLNGFDWRDGENNLMQYIVSESYDQVYP